MNSLEKKNNIYSSFFIREDWPKEYYFHLEQTVVRLALSSWRSSFLCLCPTSERVLFPAQVRCALISKTSIILEQSQQPFSSHRLEQLSSGFGGTSVAEVSPMPSLKAWSYKLHLHSCCFSQPPHPSCGVRATFSQRVAVPGQSGWKLFLCCCHFSCPPTAAQFFTSHASSTGKGAGLWLCGSDSVAP